MRGFRLEYISTPLFPEKLSRIALGTWAIGGALWGGTDEAESVATIQAAFEAGINVLDTAPAYGQGEAEMLVARALRASKKRNQTIIATKGGIEFRPDGSAVRNLTEAFIKEDLHNSLKRLETDHIDIYFMHWPDPLVPVEEVANTLRKLYEAGKIRAIGLSNFDEKQCAIFRKAAPLHFCEPPYNIFERDIERGLLPFCKKEKIMIMGYSALCRGLLSGKMSKVRVFKGDDLRGWLDKKFLPPSFEEYLEAAKQIGDIAQKKYGKTLLEFAIRWVLDQGVEIAIWGMRKRAQLDPINLIAGWKIDESTRKEIDAILKKQIKHPQNVSEYFGPPLREN